MNFKRVINTFILGTIGVIFTFDTFAYLAHNDSISEQVTGWINQSVTNLVIFIGTVLVICCHFIFDKYKD